MPTLPPSDTQNAYSFCGSTILPLHFLESRFLKSAASFAFTLSSIASTLAGHSSPSHSLANESPLAELQERQAMTMLVALSGPPRERGTT
jgi:hypothetical protein